jgi:hypothetical protein
MSPDDRFADLLAQVRPETELERRVVDDPHWRAGAAWGEPRRGHPEGMVLAHVLEVLANVEDVAVDADDRRRLRLIALLHDTFKSSVSQIRPRTKANHHATIARRFAEEHLELDDPTILDVVELHDEGHRAWKRRDPRRARRLADRLGDDFGLFLRFYRADNATGDKTPGGPEWLAEVTGRG